MIEFIKIIEAAWKEATGNKIIIRQVESSNPAFPALKQIVTEVHLWNGHKTIPFSSNTQKGKNIDELKKKGLQEFLRGAFLFNT